MRSRLSIYALVAILLLVELSAYWKLSSWLSWMSEPALAYTSAFAFISLLLGSVVVLGFELPEDVQSRIHRAVAVLLLVQGLANVLIAYQRGSEFMPVEVVSSFFNVSHDIALKATAVLQGGTLSVTSLSFWSVVGLLLRQRAVEEKQGREELRNLESLWKGDPK